MPDDLTSHLSVMQSLAERISLRGQFTETGWQPPPDMDLEEWKSAGTLLGRFERATLWWIGDWWAFGEHRYGDRRAIVNSPDWTGPSFQTCANAASVCRAFTTSRRRELLSFKHHDVIARLARVRPEVADALLEEAEQVAIRQGAPPPARDLQQAAKRNFRAVREVELADATQKASRALGSQVYSVILADPPWRFEPRSRETGMDRAADNHYATMLTEHISALTPPAAKNCALFLWGTAPMLPDAIQVLKAWRFEYKTFAVWIKPTRGTGYWLGNAHEPLLIGTRGDVPAPAEGTQPLSWFAAPRGDHSEKPDPIYEMIEAMFPNQPKLEMFARKARPGWDSWGNEAPPRADPT